MKRIVTFMTALALWASVLFPFALPVRAATGDEIRAPRKIISVVYDDSGSMFGDRWVYANYAVQALIAQLNEQDTLYITFMSDPDTAVKMDLSDLKKTVRKVRNWNHSRNTPVTSMDTAMSALEKTIETDRSTQFWCVIMTDGDFNDMEGTIQEKLNSFKGRTMSNDSALNVAYLAMGSGAVAASSDKNGGLYAYTAEDANDIASTMAQIANLISGRITADNVKQVDEKTISFHSDLPLYSISILSQQTTVSVDKAATAEESLSVDRNIALNAREPFDSCKTELYGNAAVVSGGGRVIQPGTYTISFSEAVDKSALLVQYEPAIGMKLLVERSGEQIDDPSMLRIDDKVSVQLIPINPGTQEQIDERDLPSGISWSIEYSVDDNLIDSAQKDKLKGIHLREGFNTFKGTMQIPGFAPSVFDYSFELRPIVYHFGIEVEQPDPLTYYRKNAGSGSADGSSLIFRITNDGVPLTAQEQDQIGVGLEITDVSCDNSEVKGFFNRFGNIPANCKLQRNDDGSYTITPLARAPFTAFLMKAGVYTVTVGVDKDAAVTAQGSFDMVALPADWIDLIGLIITILLICCLIYCLCFKYKFNNQTIHYEVFQLNSLGGGTLLSGSTGTEKLSRFCPNLFWPFKRATEAQICGLTFRAGPGGSVTITGKSIARKVVRYCPSISNPTTSLQSIVTAMRPTKKTDNKKETILVTDQSLTPKRPIYFQSMQGDRMIWRIRITN